MGPTADSHNGCIGVLVFIVLLAAIKVMFNITVTILVDVDVPESASDMPDSQRMQWARPRLKDRKLVSTLVTRPMGASFRTYADTFPHHWTSAFTGTVTDSVSRRPLRSANTKQVEERSRRRNQVVIDSVPDFSRKV